MHINFLTYRWGKFEGYGRHASHLVRALSANGVTVHLVPYEWVKWSAEARRLADLRFDRLTVSLLPHNHLHPLPGRQWVYTMYESPDLPPAMTNALNRTADRVLTPSTWCASIFKEHGVMVPVHVIPEGIDPYEFPYLPRQIRRPFTFVALADRGLRKGFDLVIQAFQYEFPDDPNVRLIIKTATQSGAESGNFEGDRRITVWREDVATMREVYNAADCFVFPSRGEGWGLPPREAAAMGVPTIVTRYSGLTDGIEQYATIMLEDIEERMNMMGTERCGEPDMIELASAMRRIYTTPTAAITAAAMGAQWLRDHQTWDHGARMLADLIRTEASWSNA